MKVRDLRHRIRRPGSTWRMTVRTHTRYVHRYGRIEAMQRAIVRALKNRRRVLISMPRGAGKTTMLRQVQR